VLRLVLNERLPARRRSPGSWTSGRPESRCRSPGRA